MFFHWELTMLPGVHGTMPLGSSMSLMRDHNVAEFVNSTKPLRLYVPPVRCKHAKTYPYICWAQRTK